MDTSSEPQPAVGPPADSRLSRWLFLIQVSRPGLWTTTALFYMMPLGRRIPWRSVWFWMGLFYILVPLGLMLYGVNDIVDREGDRYNPRKGTYLFGARGRQDELRALRWKIAAAQAPFLYLFYLATGPRIFLWFAVLVLAVFLYNAPPFEWKGRPPWDVLVQSSYLLVFVLSSWLHHVPQLPWPTMVFGALFAMHSHIFGEIMDIEPDQKSGRETLATRIGRVPSKLTVAVLLVVESALVWRFAGDRTIALFLATGALWFVADAALLWKDRAYRPREMRLFLWGWNLAAVLGMLWNATHQTLVVAGSRGTP